MLTSVSSSPSLMFITRGAPFCSHRLPFRSLDRTQFHRWSTLSTLQPSPNSFALFPLHLLHTHNTNLPPLHNVRKLVQEGKRCLGNKIRFAQLNTFNSMQKQDTNTVSIINLYYLHWFNTNTLYVIKTVVPVYIDRKAS